MYKVELLSNDIPFKRLPSQQKSNLHIQVISAVEIQESAEI